MHFEHTPPSCSWLRTSLKVGRNAQEPSPAWGTKKKSEKRTRGEVREKKNTSLASCVRPQRHLCVPIMANQPVRARTVSQSYPGVPKAAVAHPKSATRVESSAFGVGESVCVCGVGGGGRYMLCGHSTLGRLQSHLGEGCRTRGRKRKVNKEKVTMVTQR